MKAVAIVCLLATAAFCVSATGLGGEMAPDPVLELKSAKPAVELTSATFESLTQINTGMTSGNWFVMFYAPWCGHCKALKPIWEALATKTPSHGASVARIDCTENGDICRRFQVRGYPTMIYLARGKMYTYKGQRTLERLEEFAKAGWLDQNGDVIPKPNTLIDDAMFYLSIIWNTVQMLYKQEPKLVMAIGGGLVAFFAIVAFLATRPIADSAHSKKE